MAGFTCNAERHVIHMQVIKKQLAEGVTIRRVGLVSTGAPPRAHSPILNAEGKEVRILILKPFHTSTPSLARRNRPTSY